MTDVTKAKKLLEKLNNGGNVSLRDLEAALGKDGVAAYESRWQAELDQRSQFDEKPEAIRRYEEMIHAADFDENRVKLAKPNSPRSKRDAQGRGSGQRLEELAQHKYELALEYLEEIITADGTLRVWFDRDLTFGIGTDLDLCPELVPRTVTSRSQHRLGAGMAEKRSKAAVKREILEYAIERHEQKVKIETEAVKNDEEAQRILLKAKLSALKQSKR